MKFLAINARQGLPAVFLAALLTACGGGGGGGTVDPLAGGGGPAPTNPPPGSGNPPSVPATTFADATASSGIDYVTGTSNIPSFNVTHAPDAERIATHGAAAGDYDNDGDIDLFVVRGNLEANLLYTNAGTANFSFVDSAATAGLAFTRSATENYLHAGPTFADMDGDGDLDLFIGGVFGHPSLIFRNNLIETGTADFTDVTAGSGLDTMMAEFSVGASFGDYDLDGDLDLFVAHWGTPRDPANPGDTESLWSNETDAVNGIRFVSVSESAGISATLIGQDKTADYTFAPSFARIDGDVWPDIVVSGDFVTSRVFMNNGDGTFRDATDPAVIKDEFGMGSAVADYDEDGDLDWFVSSAYTGHATDAPNLFPVGNRLYRNNSGVFEDVTVAAGVRSGGWGWGACFLDFENDGDLDIYHTNGWHAYPDYGFTTDYSRAFLSDGQGQFDEEAAELGLDDDSVGRGVICADFDGDGDIDIFQQHGDDVLSATLWRNDAVNNYLVVKLVGLAPNTEAVGARIRVFADGREWVREVMIGSNFQGHNPTLQYFGLGTIALVDRIEVEWPGISAPTTVMTSVQAQQVVTIDQDP